MMKKVYLAILGLVLIATAAFAANPTIIGPTEVRCIVGQVQTTKEIFLFEVEDPYGSSEVNATKVKIQKVASARRWYFDLRYSVDSCKEIRDAIRTANTRAIAQVKAMVQNNSSRISANEQAIAKLQKCCKKNKKVVRRHYKKKTKVYRDRVVYKKKWKKTTKRKRKNRAKKRSAKTKTRAAEVSSKKSGRIFFTDLKEVKNIQEDWMDKGAAGFVSSIPNALAVGYSANQARKGAEAIGRGLSKSGTVINNVNQQSQTNTTGKCQGSGCGDNTRPDNNGGTSANDSRNDYNGGTSANNSSSDPLSVLNTRGDANGGTSN